MITVGGLTYTYTHANTPAVKSLEFDVERGEIFGFLGPNGAGKSTTQKILIRLLSGYRGSVRVLGKDLAQWPSDYYERVGVSFELPNHYLKLSAIENLTYFSSLYAGVTLPADRLLEWVDLKDAGSTLVSQFSKGMKSRLSIARSLLNDPELIFLDEPTTGLDPVSGRRIKELIKAQKAAGKTVFLTTHDMTIADELCDRIAFIVEGRIQLIDAPRNLKLEHGRHTVRVEYGRDGQTEQRDFPLDGLGENGEFAQLLRREPIQTIHSQEATLEDVFIQVTGRKLR